MAVAKTVQASEKARFLAPFPRNCGSEVALTSPSAVWAMPCGDREERCHEAGGSLGRSRQGSWRPGCFRDEPLDCETSYPIARGLRVQRLPVTFIFPACCSTLSILGKKKKRKTLLLGLSLKPCKPFKDFCSGRRPLCF